ncbi:transcriptional regulator [Ahniella affigens]|uniref:Transcriptional regulator n=1 Tax=Ahniella affigens TaxID=2021234 RepID=A0A2P1PRG8_9GAMM|nr:metalloregulator ArsR/SmtB family transcription factor [Ahniella affigens]AVP97447.1 transcriptional regulator [Ahniella affigens]
MNLRRDVFQAIADPTRRAILTLVAADAMTAGQIAEHFDSARPTVSKHLQILAECELLTATPTGREIRYSLHVDKMQEIDSWLSPFRSLWQTRFQQLDDVLSTMKRRGK